MVFIYKIGVTQTDMCGVSHTGIIALSHTEKVVYGAYIKDNMGNTQKQSPVSRSLTGDLYRGNSNFETVLQCESGQQSP